MGIVFDFKEAKACQNWYDNPKNRFAVEMQHRLMMDMLTPNRGETILEIGCGTGLALKPFAEAGLGISGIDPSPYMLDLARKNLGNRPDLHRGFAEDLPFDDNSFNHAFFLTSLEFVEDPVAALEEACRVAKDQLFIGVLNRYALKGIQRRVKGVFVPTIFNRARFFGVWELKHVLRSILGDVPVAWRTVCHLSQAPGRYLSGFEKSRFVQRCPFGTFAGVRVSLVPRFKTRPLSLKYTPKRSIRPVAGGSVLGATRSWKPICTKQTETRPSDVTCAATGV